MSRAERAAALKAARDGVRDITLGWSRADWNQARAAWATVREQIPIRAPRKQLEEYFADGGRPTGATRMAILEHQRLLVAWLDGYLTELSAGEI